MRVNFFIQLVSFLFFSSLIVAQSDYRITQEFKSRHRSFEIAIEYAKTVDELDKIKKEINEFKNEFKGNSELLNRALYPANFESSFKTLAKKIEYTNKKLAEIKTLQNRVVQVETDYAKISDELKKLTSEVNTLRNSNAKLMAELKAFKSGYGGSKEAIDSLNNIIAQLKFGISKRDTLIKEIMDNIFMTAEHKIESLDDAEKKSLQANIQSTSLIENIINLVNDNIEFLNASLLNLQDLNALKNEFNDFEQRWDHFGPKLFDIYSTDEKNRDKLTEIDTLILHWNNSLNTSVWKSIREIFLTHNFELENFTTGAEFESVVNSFIDDNIEGNGAAIQDEHNYIIFADRVWDEIVKAEWMPFLLANDLISTEQVTSIENKLNEWEDSSGGSQSYFIYAIIILLAVVIIISFILINRKKKKTEEISEDTEVTAKDNVKEGRIGLTDEFIDDDKDEN